MSREKKDAKNFACKFDREIFEKLEEFCKLSGQNKTAVVERAVEKYIEENLEMIKEVAKKL
jgi:predicted DNA-binding protein